MDETTSKEDHHLVYDASVIPKTLEEQMKYYVEAADVYEKKCEETFYFFPDILTKELHTLKLPLDSKILDVGAGTGLSGEVLKDLGYTNIDALDGCEEMLKLSKDKGIYNNFILAMVETDKELPIPDNTYDVALMYGSAGPAHIDVTAYKQLIRVVKPGGIVGWILEDPKICNLVNSRFHDNLYLTLEKFVNEKLWVPVDGYNPKTVPNALLKRPGDVFFYKVL